MKESDVKEKQKESKKEEKEKKEKVLRICVDSL